MKVDELVSVLVGSYREEKYIADCLESILNQTYPNIELIIANDCSDDYTFDIAKEWVNKNGDKFVRCEIYQNVTNLGISKNYNSLIKKANGKYVKLIAADDILLPSGIKLEVEYLAEHNEIEIMYGNCVIIGEEDSYPLILHGDEKLFYDNSSKQGLDLTKDLLVNDFISAPSVMFRRRTFDSFGLFREDLAFEDWEYWLRLTSKGAVIGYLDEKIVAYRVYEGSNSHTGKGKDEERRFRKNMETEERVYSEYSDYVEDYMLDNYWNNVLNICMRNNYKDTLEIVLKNKRFNKTLRTKVSLIIYRLHLFSIVRKMLLLLKRTSR